MAKQQPIKKQQLVQKPVIKTKPIGSKPLTGTKSIFDFLEEWVKEILQYLNN